MADNNDDRFWGNCGYISSRQWCKDPDTVRWNMLVENDGAGAPFAMALGPRSQEMSREQLESMIPQKQNMW